MKMLFVIALLALAGCTKKNDCMHMHVGGLQLEMCSPDIHCTESEDGKNKMRTCQYIPSGKTDETK